MWGEWREGRDQNTHDAAVCPGVVLPSFLNLILGCVKPATLLISNCGLKFYRHNVDVAVWEGKLTVIAMNRGA